MHVQIGAVSGNTNLLFGASTRSYSKCTYLTLGLPGSHRTISRLATMCEFTENGMGYIKTSKLNHQLIQFFISKTSIVHNFFKSHFFSKLVLLKVCQNRLANFGLTEKKWVA